MTDENATKTEPKLSIPLEGITQVIDTSPTEGRLRTLDELERDYIEAVLKLTNGNRSEAAKILGIGRATLHRKLRRFKEATAS